MRLCELLGSLSGKRIAPSLMRTAHAECAKRPSASPPRRRSRAHFAAMQTHGFVAESRPRIRRIPTAIQMARRRVTNRQSEPCRRCAAAHSSAADALTYITLVLHAKSGPRMRRSPRSAVPCSSGMALRCRPRMPPNLQLGAEAAPIQIISSDDMTECYFGRQSDRDAMWPTPTRANAPTNLKSRASARAGCRSGSQRGRGSGQARPG